ncbi:MAG: ROK family protein [Anaerolineaceae bacterium]|nr:ROK family protein [Anaerolineaceae bacterium]
MSANPARVAIGVDLGGTNIRSAIVTLEGIITARNRIATPLRDGQFPPPAGLVEAIADCVHPLLDTPGIAGIGVGSGGQFNPETGVMLGINTDHPDFVNQPIATMLSERLSCPVYIDNDVKAAAFAELRCGAGRGYQNIICAAVGTFVGGALILDGRVVNGANGLAGHLGQLVDYGTGVYLEDVAGGVPLGKRAIKHGLLQPGQTAEDLFKQARTGHTPSQQFIHNTGRALGYALAGLAHFIQPDVILIGGSVGLQPEYLEAINAGLQEKLLTNWRSIRALPMQLGTDAGQIGAGLRVFEELPG